MRRIGALPAYYLLTGATGTADLLVSTVLQVYFIQAANLSPLQLAIVGATLMLTQFVFEVPTGIVADIYSRRLSILIGVFLVGIALVIEGSLPRFEVILIAQIILGIGNAFTSGATTAWIADEVGNDRVTTVLLRGRQLGQAAGLIAIVASGLLAARFSLSAPIVCGGLIMLSLGVFLWLTMPETHFTPADRASRQSWNALYTTAQSGVRLLRIQPALLLLLGVTVCAGVTGQGVDRFWEALFLAQFQFPNLFGLPQVAWFSVFNFGATLCSIATTGVIARLIEQGRATPARLLPGLYVLLCACVVAMGLAPSFAFALVALWSMVIAGEAINPLFEAYLNQYLPSNVRATMLSLNSQVGALGGVSGSLFLGAIANASLRWAMVLSGLFVLPAAYLIRRFAQHQARHAR